MPTYTSSLFHSYGTANPICLSPRVRELCQNVESRYPPLLAILFSISPHVFRYGRFSKSIRPDEVGACSSGVYYLRRAVPVTLPCPGRTRGFSYSFISFLLSFSLRRLQSRHAPPALHSAHEDATKDSQ